MVRLGIIYVMLLYTIGLGIIYVMLLSMAAEPNRYGKQNTGNIRFSENEVSEIVGFPNFRISRNSRVFEFSCFLIFLSFRLL